MDNLWALGGEITRDLHENPSLRGTSIEQMLADAIDEEGGPLPSGVASEEQQRSWIPPAESWLSSSPSQVR